MGRGESVPSWKETLFEVCVRERERDVERNRRESNKCPTESPVKRVVKYRRWMEEESK